MNKTIHRKPGFNYKIHGKVAKRVNDYIALLKNTMSGQSYNGPNAFKMIGTLQNHWSNVQTSTFFQESGKPNVKTSTTVDSVAGGLRQTLPGLLPGEDEHDPEVVEFWEKTEATRLELASDLLSDQKAKKLELANLLPESSLTTANSKPLQVEKYPLALSTQNQLIGFSFAELLSRGNSIQQISDLMEMLDGKYPFPVQYKDEYGSSENWNPIYDKGQDGGYFIFENSEMVGFFFFLFVDDQTFQRGILGENIDDTITHENIIDPVLPGEYKVFFADAFIAPGGSGGGKKRVLLEEFYQILGNFAEYGIFISDMFTNATTPPALDLVNAIGFAKTCDHRVHRKFDVNQKPVPTEIFSLDLRSDFRKLFGKSTRLTGELMKRYEDYFGES